MSLPKLSFDTDTDTHWQRWQSVPGSSHYKTAKSATIPPELSLNLLGLSGFCFAFARKPSGSTAALPTRATF